MIKLTNVRKNFGDFTALKDISFSIEKGELVYLLGENGAGKTTTMRILSTLIEHSSGQVIIDGEECVHDNINLKKKIGIVTEDAKPYPQLSPIENMKYFGSFYHNMVKTNDLVDKLVVDLDLDDFKDKKVDTLSKGNRQKVAIANTLIANPDILILDELMSGLDISTQATIKKLIYNLHNDGKTMILSTHHMDEVYEMGNRVIIINRGRITYDGHLSDIKETDSRKYLEDKLTNWER